MILTKCPRSGVSTTCDIFNNTASSDVKSFELEVLIAKENQTLERLYNHIKLVGCMKQWRSKRHRIFKGYKGHRKMKQTQEKTLMNQM